MFYRNTNNMFGVKLLGMYPVPFHWYMDGTERNGTGNLFRIMERDTTLNKSLLEQWRVAGGEHIFIKMVRLIVTFAFCSSVIFRPLLTNSVIFLITMITLLNLLKLQL